jgi:RNA recognition motif-containing protein
MEELKKLNFGIDSVKISFNENGESRGYGFILFSSKEDASKFIQTKPSIGQASIETSHFEKRLLKGDFNSSKFEKFLIFLIKKTKVEGPSYSQRAIPTKKMSWICFFNMQE